MKTSAWVPAVVLSTLFIEGCTLDQSPEYPGHTTYAVGYAGYRPHTEYNTYVPYYWGPQHYNTIDEQFSPAFYY